MAWLFLGHFSPIYGLVSAVWCTVFTEYWKHQEIDLGVRWGVRGVSRIDSHKRDFKAEKTITDPVTGEKVGFFSSGRRFARQLLQIPFALAVVFLLGTVIATCFGIEVFISEVYDGPLKSVLVSLLHLLYLSSIDILGFHSDWYSYNREPYSDHDFNGIRNASHEV